MILVNYLGFTELVITQKQELNLLIPNVPIYTTMTVKPKG